VEQEHPQEYLLVKLLHTKETLLVRLPDLELDTGAKIVIGTKYGNDIAEIQGRVKAAQALNWEEIVDIVRLADSNDLQHFRDNLAREKEAYSVCRQKIEQHKLDMKLVSVHYVLDEAKIVFFFSSENRVDFRELVRDLVSVFHQRIELRQIGVRDEARITGGIAVCGRVLCCSGVSDKLLSVSIKMAKVQNLSLNSMKISGPCGRLLCCLAYEYEAYKSDRKLLPPDGMSFVFDTHHYHIHEVNVLSKKITLRSDDGYMFPVTLDTFKQDEQGGAWSFIGPLSPPEHN